MGLHGAGKGDAPRTIFDAAWRARYDAINWDQCPACRGARQFRGVDTWEACTACQGTGKNHMVFERSGVRLVKRYR